MLLLLFVFARGAFAQADAVSRSWNQPVEPFRIAGNVYYVGASEITSFLITSPAGHILIDGGFVETAEQIERNVEKLGFRLSDVRYLVNSHAHYDHAGGLAELKRATGARFLASAGDIPLLARGGADDPQFANRFLFPPIYADGIVRDGQRIRVGGTELVAHITAGHTRGCTTWTTRVREQNRDLSVVFLCSATVPSSYRLIGNPQYPSVAGDYRATFAFLKSLKPDIPLAAHGNFFNLEEKIRRRGEARSPFIDPAAYQRIVADWEKRFEDAFEAQRSKGGAVEGVATRTSSIRDAAGGGRRRER